MSSLDFSKLRQADIILTQGNSASSTVIRVSTISKYSHAVLYVGNNNIIHALTDKGVNKDTLNNMLSETALADVYRLETLNQKQRDAIVAYAYTQIGREYDYSEAAGSADHSSILALPLGLISPKLLVAGLVTSLELRRRSNKEGNRDQLFCSELVVAAYQSAGVNIYSGNPSAYAPQELLTKDLKFVGSLKSKP